MEKKIVVWHNLNNDTYYYKIIKGYYGDYYVGYKNQYNHEIIIVINKIYTEPGHISFKDKVLRKVIFFLQRIIKKIERRMS